MAVDFWNPTDLSGKVALVTGATRGVGKGIALVLGECGATVYVTGRSQNQETTTEGLPGTLELTTQAIEQAGGKGIGVVCDHTQDEDVERLFAQIEKEQGKLDFLINNVWGGYENHDDTFEAKFWEQPLWRWEGMFTAGVRAHFVASQHAARLMVPKRKGVIVNISAGDNQKFLHNTLYDTAKNAVDRMAFGMAQELRKHQVTTMVVYPGWVRTERVQQNLGADADYSATHSVYYAGRAMASLLTDPNIFHRTGKIFTVGDLAREFSFTDVDGRQIAPFEIPEYSP
ncbi:MAG TPA: oxidoreductase [Cytophagales bacterium]|nr:oxidoreductase [Cytophagales bacterium]